MKQSLGKFSNISLKNVSLNFLSKTNKQDIINFYRKLPDIYWFGLEIPLKSNQIDFHQGIRCNESNLIKITEYLDSNPNIAFKDNLLKLFHKLNLENSIFNKIIDYIVFEFDTDNLNENLIPGVFIAFKEESSLEERLIVTKEFLLIFDKTNPKILKNLEICFSKCKNLENISHIAIMLSRKTEAIRINIRKLGYFRIKQYLKEIGYKYETKNLENNFFNYIRLVDRITFCFDIGEEILPRIGMECTLVKQPIDDNRYKFISKLLKKDNLVNHDKYEHLLNLSGFISPIKNINFWDEEILLESLVKSKFEFTVVEKKISHVKIDSFPDKKSIAKAYIGFEYNWFNKEKINNLNETDNKSKINQNVSSSFVDNLNNSIELSIDFLSQSRHQSGWWQDYPDSPINCSDEWVTAYVGYVLSFFDKDKCISLAKEAWNLLEKCNRTSGGWGWNGTKAADADSTIWAIRLARSLKIKNEKVDKAINFVLNHQHKSGGIATYENDYFFDFHDGGKGVDYMLDKWCLPHSCVTAASLEIDELRDLALNYLRLNQLNSGLWNSYWWLNKEFSSAMVIEGLSKYGNNSDQKLINKTVNYIILEIEKISLESYCEQKPPFLLANTLNILLNSNNNERFKFIEKISNYLFRSQRSDGSWESSAILYSIFEKENLNKVDYDTNSNHTTATILNILNKLKNHGFGF